MDIDRVMPKLGEVFLDASSPASREVTQYKTGLFGRSQVIIIIINIIIITIIVIIITRWSTSPYRCWCPGCTRPTRWPRRPCSPTVWLRRLLLEDHDPAVRRDMCTGIYRMCMGSSSNGRTGVTCVAPMLAILLEFLEDAQLMKPQR